MRRPAPASPGHGPTSWTTSPGSSLSRCRRRSTGSRWLTVWCGLAFCLIAGAYALWIATSPDALRALGSDSTIKQYVEKDFIDYYSENPAASFAGAVWTNNAWISAQAVALGITGFWVPMILFGNAQGVGVAAGVFAAVGKSDVFLSYILPHGLMELTAVFIACAAGLKIFWALVPPGPRTRGQAVAAEGRSLITVALGLVLVLFVSGLVEGFVTPSGLPMRAKDGNRRRGTRCVLDLRPYMGPARLPFRGQRRSGQRGCRVHGPGA